MKQRCVEVGYLLLLIVMAMTVCMEFEQQPEFSGIMAEIAACIQGESLTKTLIGVGVFVASLKLEFVNELMLKKVIGIIS